MEECCFVSSQQVLVRSLDSSLKGMYWLICAAQEPVWRREVEGERKGVEEEESLNSDQLLGDCLLPFSSASKQQVSSPSSQLRQMFELF